eukprot:SAG11_NODE_750_length_7360_cov_7.329522_3_plen_91_part_00
MLALFMLSFVLRGWLTAHGLAAQLHTGEGYDNEGRPGSMRSTCYTRLAAMPGGRGVVVSYDQDYNKALDPAHGMIVFSMRLLIRKAVVGA